MSKFKRILLKLSGEALAGEKGHGIDNQILSDMASEIASIVKQGVQVALVIGGGNLVRGISASAGGMNRAQGDAMGMLGTVMNGLAMQDALDKQGVDSVVMSAIRMEPVCEFFDRRKALKLLSAGSVVIFSAGTGNPFFTTDSCAALRAIESECDVIMKATKVDGIYTADPVKDPTATRFDDISYKEVISRGLKVMDTAAVALCMENNMPIFVFKMEKGNLTRAAVQGDLGTLVRFAENYEPDVESPCLLNQAVFLASSALVFGADDFFLNQVLDVAECGIVARACKGGHLFHREYGWQFSVPDGFDNPALATTQVSLLVLLQELHFLEGACNFFLAIIN